MVVFFSCEKKVEFIPETVEPKLVVDAEIENGMAPLVVLTYSTGFFSKIDSATAANLFVRNARVKLSDGAITYQLREYPVKAPSGVTFYVYSNDFLNASTAITGALGKTYNLQIELNGKIYTSTTTIPLLTKKIDSLWWLPAPLNPDPKRTSLMCRVTDPPGFGNYIRYFTQTGKNGNFFPGENSVFDDNIVDGKTYDIQVDRGFNRSQERNPNEDDFFLRGDTVTVKFCNIDKASYDFWNTWEFAAQSIGNPFAAPNKVLGNISNGALGVFAGYAAQYKTLVIPK